MDQRQNQKKNDKLQEPRYNFLYANEKKNKSDINLPHQSYN